ncbi:hypothetical protein [Dysgonomonas termitidis]|uniref:Lipoprotein n=1 Tax=Dysgonomonas termitidis TaxID=1516126 RepID=A0ABV9KV05_9BACT
MVRIICLLFFFIFLSSCASRKKKDSHLSVSSASGASLSVTGRSADSLWHADWSRFFESEDTDIYIRKYDTAAKPDSAGNYPLQEEKNIRSRRNAQKEQQTAAGESKREDTRTDYTAASLTDITADQKEESATETASLFNLNWLWFIIIPAVGIFIIKKFILKK